MRVPDNLSIYEDLEYDRETRLEKKPVCDWCGEHIQSDYGYRIDGDLICQNCMDDFIKEAKVDMDLYEEG